MERLVQAALEEDVGSGDLTTRAVVPPARSGEAVIVAKAPGVVAGLPVAEIVFRTVDAGIRWSPLATDGRRVEPGQVLARLAGPASAILTAERVALNFLQQLSGVATATRALVDACAGTRCRVLDTRKTVPGLRALQRYAFRVGGGLNHRFGLADGMLIKENHIAAAGGIPAALERARASAGPMVGIEVEVESLEQLAEAIEAGATRILLDNMDLDTLREAVRRTAGRAVLEASGNITPERAAQVAATGVDFLSTGFPTHSAPALDLSLRLTLSG